MSDIFVGDNDHGDALPEPTCRSCGVAWVDHTGIMGVCVDNKALREDLKDSLESHDEMRLEIAQLTKERDEANSLVWRILSEINCRIENGADSNGHLEGLWGLYKQETQAMDNIAKLDEELGL